jgi:ABC-type transport system involved in multi-copper enzyme maturation permease subunit
VIGRLAALGRPLANPLAAKEMRSRLRGPRPFVVATLYLLPLGVLAVALYAAAARSATANAVSGFPVGALYFAALSALELGLICLLAPAFTADLVSGERERRTLDLLLVTGLSRRQIVVGKLAAALGSLLQLIVLAVPLQAVAILLGGVGPEEIAVAFLILVLTTVTYGCAGLYWSARLRSTRAAVLLAYATTLAGTVVLPAAGILSIAASELLFGLRGNPFGWLVGDPPTEARVQLAAILGQLASATNPPLTGVFSAVTLTRGRGLVFTERLGGFDVTLVAPWLLFAVVHVAAIGLLLWLTVRALRRYAP